MARIYKDVLPSGVQFEVRNLLGKDQELITDEKKSRDGKVFTKMLASALVSLGNNNNVTERDVERMLTNDRKYALVMLRQHSLRFKPEFDFTYDWPLADNQKIKEEYSVIFTREYFKIQPYEWVRLHMEALKATAAAAGEPFDENVFPVMFENYSDVHALREITATLPESGARVKWMILNGELEEKAQHLPARNSSTIFHMREAKQILQLKDGGTEPVVTGLITSEMDLMDLEYMRKRIREIEGSVDTILTVSSKKNPDKQARIDLVGTPDFFFPSQAI